jgi:hypothetical protein
MGIACSCEKVELPVPAYESGNVITNSVKMESDYRYQLYFDLETNTIVKQNLNAAGIWNFHLKKQYRN